MPASSCQGKLHDFFEKMRKVCEAATAIFRFDFINFHFDGAVGLCKFFC